MNESDIAAGFATITTRLDDLVERVDDVRTRVDKTNGSVAALKEHQIRLDERGRVAKELAADAALALTAASSKATVANVRRARFDWVRAGAVGLVSGCGVAVVAHFLG